MKVVCKCFGGYSGVDIRSSPFIRIDNIIGKLPTNSIIDIENYMYNDIWFKLQGREAYILSWLRTHIGLIDYAYDRGMLKTFSKKFIIEGNDAVVVQKQKEVVQEEEVIEKEEEVVEKEDVVVQEEEVVEKEDVVVQEDVVVEKEEEDVVVEKEDVVVKKEKGVIEKRKGRYKKERIPATVRNIVWVTHFKTSKKGQCWLCKVEDISSANFECGHVVSEKNGGKVTIDNLRPVCGFCNKSVGSMNMEDFKKKYNIK